MTLTKARWHVFNKMPIRILAFDSTGANLQLISQEEIFRRILPKIRDATSNQDFLSAWQKTQELRDDSFVYEKNKKDKQHKLLIDVMERTAQYAILSHTWIRDSPGDVTYRNWETRKLSTRGYAKVTKFCEVAARIHGLTLGWMDNVCINKDSSTELDESIRSMYKWYRGAHICISYLSETQQLADGRTDSWFTRGWTLQELLAPMQTCFYNSEWVLLGFTDEESVVSLITSATTITKRELGLCQQGKIERIPISRRLQMASRRQVTREEDTSYSLMGVLAVDIPIAYGEGSERAFFRLVRELLATKKNILDLFNRAQDESNRILPHSIDLYSKRKDAFDAPNQPTGTLLDLYSPPEPIILTHLGLRITLLLAPGVLTMFDNGKRYPPRGGISGTYDVFFYLDDRSDRPHTYSILDRRIFSGDLPPFPNNIRKYIRQHYVVTFAIINFGVEDDNIHLPESCLSFMMLCDGAKPGYVKPSDNIRIPAAPPAIFKLHPHKNKYEVFPKDDLRLHGLQLVTLYL